MVWGILGDPRQNDPAGIRAWNLNKPVPVTVSSSPQASGPPIRGRNTPTNTAATTPYGGQAQNQPTANLGGSGGLLGANLGGLLSMALAGAGGAMGRPGLLALSTGMVREREKEQERKQQQEMVSGIMGITDPAARAQAFVEAQLPELGMATMKAANWKQERAKRNIDMASAVAAMERGEIQTGLNFIEKTRGAAADFDQAEMRYQMYKANTARKSLAEYTSADDTALIMTALKMMDSSTVMQGELEMAADAGKIGNWKKAAQEVMEGKNIVLGMNERQAWHDMVENNIGVMQNERRYQQGQYIEMQRRYPWLIGRSPRPGATYGPSATGTQPSTPSVPQTQRERLVKRGAE